MNYIVHNANVILTDRIIYGGSVEITGERITGVFEKSNFPKRTCYEYIDCKGMYLSPGFIDIHVHGGGGEDFMNGTEKAVEAVLTTHGRHGTTAMLPTTLSSSQEKVIAALKSIEKAQRKRTKGPKILGARLEGNFFSMNQKGAQDPEYIYPPSEDKYEPLIDAAANIKMISCAPELKNACAFSKKMAADGVVMSVAHSDADYDEFMKGVECGFSHITHIYNGNSWLKSPYYYCKVGACEAALITDSFYVEVIADGRHLPWQLLKMIYMQKGADWINLCTDAMCAAGMPEGGGYKLGGLDVKVEDGVAVIPDRSSFAGSVCTSDRAVRTMYKDAGVPLHDAVKMMSATPARIIGEFGSIGSIAVGKKADLNIFDGDINIMCTLIDGVFYNNNLF